MAKKPDYSSWSNRKIAGVDSGFKKQSALYTELLKNQITDYTNQQNQNNANSKIAKNTVHQNKIQGMTGSAEDFLSRGMMGSGYFTDAQAKMSDAYKRQWNSIDRTQKANNQNLTQQIANAKTQNNANMTTARLDALARLTRTQSLT